MLLDPPLGPLAELRWAIVRDILADLRPRRVLEIGCGQGAFGARIAKTSDYLGVEADPTSFAVAHQRIAPVGGRVIFGGPELIDDFEEFDLVCAFEVIEHIDDDLGALTEWIGRVAPGGTAIVSAPAGPERFGPWDELVGHYRRYSPEQLDSALVGAGCVDVRHVLYGWPLGFLTEAARNRIAERRQRAGTQLEVSMRTAASGRTLQPKRIVGIAAHVGTVPFAVMQRMRPSVGIGLVSVGHMR